MTDVTSKPTFRFASALSTATDLDQALDEVCRAADELDGTPDLAVAFVSSDRADASDAIARRICARLGSERLIGCTGESIVGVGCEVEAQPALSLWLARLPGVELLPMHLTFERTSEGGSFLGWPDSLLEGWPQQATLLALGEPFSFPADVLLDQLNRERPGTTVIGGMASGTMQPGTNRVLLGPRAFSEGAVAVLAHGDLQVRSLVSQGCRPVGRHFVVTKAERNAILELGGKPALQALHDLLTTLPAQEQEMVRRGLHLGRVVSEYQDKFEQGDFLVRNVLGIDPDQGAVIIGDYVKVGQTVQFHIRDWETADGELRQLLDAAKSKSTTTPGGALLFTCNGRGTRLFPEANHDAAAVQAAWGDVPLAGFFAAGELGPVGGHNFMHGFTASMAIFEQPQATE